MIPVEEKQTYCFDKLQMFFGDDYKIAEGIVISQPSIGDILEYGEKEFYHMLNPFITNPTSVRVVLWQNGVDWTKISEYELFIQLILQSDFTPDKTSLLFGNLDFSKFQPFKKRGDSEESNDNIVLIDAENNIKIDKEIYSHISLYLRTMFNIFPKTEKAKGRTTKEWMIEEEIAKMKIEKEKSNDSTLLSMISFCLNHPGFKYKKSELKNLGIVEFNDSVQRLLVYESTTSLMKGMYSGFVDTSKIDKKEFNFLRELHS